MASGITANLFIVSATHRTLGHIKLRAEFPGEPFTTITTEDFAGSIKRYVRKFRRYKRAVLFTYDMETAPHMAVWQGILWWIGHNSVVLDAAGRRRTPSVSSLVLHDVPQIAMEFVRLPFLLRRIRKDLKHICKKNPATYPDHLCIAFLRTDLWFGVKSGGSVTHTAGVAGSFRNFGIPTFLVSSDRCEFIEHGKIPLFVVRAVTSMQNIQGGAEIAYNHHFIREAGGIFAERQPTLIYQRYSRFNYSGAYLAATWKLPFVLEYNGSEVWIAKNWGAPANFSKLGMEIEMTNVKAADAIIVVSQPLKDELVTRGIAPGKILVNPNGVDISRFDPEVVRDKSIELRRQLSLEANIVVGLVCTFGPWHGAEVLARAIRPVIERDPRVHFVFIGDGTTRSSVTNILRDMGVAGSTTLTGMIEPRDVPRYLGACDVVVSPHVPNRDGTPFFGSPTKLFEYMAMARAIVASRLDQLADILEHRETALLVTPASTDELVEAILELAGNPKERERLGSNARTKVIANYTWSAHSSKILQHVRDVLNSNGLQ